MLFSTLCFSLNPGWFSRCYSFCYAEIGTSWSLISLLHQQTPRWCPSWCRHIPVTSSNAGDIKVTSRPVECAFNASEWASTISTLSRQSLFLAGCCSLLNELIKKQKRKEKKIKLFHILLSLKEKNHWRIMREILAFLSAVYAQDPNRK